MGCDGGTIPKRHELVKGPKKVEKVDKNAELAAKWKYCALSQEKLRRPIVSCELGRLYNKDAIIEYLLDKSAERPNAEAVTHIRGIKDIKELNLTDNPEWEGERRNAKGDRYEDIHCGMFICPVVGLEMNGKHRFCYLQTCGCVFSDRALKEIKTEICHKKSKKSKAVETVSAPPESKGLFKAQWRNYVIQKLISVAGPSGASSSTKCSKSLAASATKRSIQDMEEKSEAFKSLFTTHSSAKRSKDQTSNWVTHTPYHF
uniref:Replication termination factor 2 n=1 Tax=Xiphophorus maculatus TaxID=8083 RepID=M4AY75_XIPMA